MINQFFDIVVCLTQKDRPDRGIMFDQECEKWGIKSELFYSIKNKDPKVSFCESQIGMLKWCLEQEGDTFLTLEDDVDFRLESLQQSINQLPKDWTMFYLGANVKPYPEFTPAEYYSPNLRIIKSAFCTHAVAYRRELIEEIVRTYEYKEGQLYDTWLDIHILKTRPVYICCPMTAIQKPVNSTLWDRTVDYGDIWKGSDDYLLGVR